MALNQASAMGESPEQSHKLLEEILSKLGGPAIIYFQAGWCEDCVGNEEAVKKFITGAGNPGKEITLIRVVASTSRDDWKSDKGPNWQNLFRHAPWTVDSLPHAVVAQYVGGGPKVIERVMIPDISGLNYLLQRARLQR